MHDDARRHQEVWALLPWLANGSATPAQRRQADAHLRGCADCRAELAREEALVRDLAATPTHAPDVELGLQRLMQRLDQADAAQPAPAAARARWPALAGVRLRLGSVAALGLAELLLVLAALWWWGRPVSGDAGNGDAPYRTLTQREAVAGDGPRWRVVFQGQQTVGELQALLRAQGLVIVAGPSEAGVFTLGPAAAASAASGAAEVDALAARLRQSPHVLFAEGLPPRPSAR